MVDLTLAGYFSYEYANTDPAPYKCPPLNYCPEGSAEPTTCPDGQWTIGWGSTSSSDCIPCERGKFCNFETMVAEASGAQDWWKTFVYYDGAPVTTD
jgi:hypothetical protein